MFIRVLKAFLLVAVVVSLVGCSATPTRRSFKEGWKDSVVSTKVKFKLMGDKLVKKRNIDVDTWRGVVTMTGRITSMEEKERAEQLAWQVMGVRGVDNFLKLVEDAHVETGEAVAEGQPPAEIKETDMLKIKETASGTKIVEKTVITEKRPATHPMKSTAPQSIEPKVSNKVEGPVVYEDKEVKKKWTAKRSKYEKPESAQIKEEDLTNEDDLAREAAEELRKLRGEDITE